MAPKWKASKDLSQQVAAKLSKRIHKGNQHTTSHSGNEHLSTVNNTSSLQCYSVLSFIAQVFRKMSLKILAS